MSLSLRGASKCRRGGDGELEGLLPFHQVGPACQAVGYQDRGGLYTEAVRLRKSVGHLAGARPEL